MGVHPARPQVHPLPVEGDASRQELEELLAAVHGRSPVFDTVTRAVPVQVTLAD